MKLKLQNFKYKDLKGKVTDRQVYVTGLPGDKVFGLDLSEFSEEEREFYVAELGYIYDTLKEQIVELGLKHQYRMFKESGIIE